METAASGPGTIPPLALSVRQPWAWAIVHGGKDIENRSAGSIRAGGMAPGTIAVHAATGMRRVEYDWAFWRMAQDGVAVPRPDALVRGAIIGVVDVIDIVSESDSAWFGGPMGLRLARPRAVTPVPCVGQLGYFRWIRRGQSAPPAPWMRRWGVADGDAATGDLFDDVAPSFRTPPTKPFGSRKT